MCATHARTYALAKSCAISARRAPWAIVAGSVVLDMFVFIALNPLALPATAWL